MTTRWAIIAFAVGACIGVVMTLPASIFVPAHLDKQLDVHGSVFAGRASMSEPIRAIVSWDLERLPILWLTLSGQFAINGDGLDIAGGLSFRLGSLTLGQVSATLHSTFFNRLLLQEGVSLEKSVTAELTEVVFSVDNRIVESASGELSWPGGRIEALGPGGQPIRLDVPPLRGVITTSSEGIELVISEENGSEVARFLLDHEGVITEVVLKNVQNWANVAFKGSGDEVLFKRQRRLYGRQ